MNEAREAGRSILPGTRKKVWEEVRGMAEDGRPAGVDRAARRLGTKAGTAREICEENP